MKLERREKKEVLSFIRFWLTIEMHCSDGIAECNANRIHKFTVDGRDHSLHYWDSKYIPNEVMLARFLQDMKNIIAEHHFFFRAIE